MGNKNSSTSKAQYGSQPAKIASTQPHYDAPNPRKMSSKSAHQHCKKPLGNDEAFTTYIKDARVKMKSKSNIGGHEDHNNAIPVVEANETNNMKEDDQGDHFSAFIHNARKKLRTITRKSSSIRRG